MPKISRESKSIAKKLVNECHPTQQLRAFPNNAASVRQVAGAGLNNTKTYNQPATKKTWKKLK